MLTIKNHHVEDCGQPPQFDTDGKYVCYHENTYGEQLVFIADHQTKQARLWHGDLGWDEVREISPDCMIPAMMLADDEKIWLISCWMSFLNMNFQQVLDAYNEHAKQMARSFSTELKDETASA